MRDSSDGAPTMDTTTFDTIARTVSSSMTRRSAFRGLFAGAATVVAGGVLLQGEDDKVVPLQQAQLMADGMAAAGKDVELVVYPGEGHGFRQASTNPSTPPSAAAKRIATARASAA